MKLVRPIRPIRLARPAKLIRPIRNRYTKPRETMDTWNQTTLNKQTAQTTPLPHDCHIHLALDGVDWKKAQALHQSHPNEEYIRQTLAAYSQADFAYLRDGGDSLDVSRTVRRIAREYGIEYVSPCFAIYQAGSYGSFLGRSFEDMQEYETLVDEVAQMGGDFIKLILTGIMDFKSYGKITGKVLYPESIRMMVAYAHARGFAVMAHVNGSQSVQAAIEAGVDSIEHGYYLDTPTKYALANSKIIWVPTLSPVANLVGTGIADDNILKKILCEQSRAVFEVAQMGGIIALGSDAGSHGVYHVEAAASELSLLQDALGDGWEQVLERGFSALRSRFSAHC